MSLENNIPKNSYMLWLKEHRDSIKSEYLSNYIPKIIDGRKESIVGLLAKKTGEIWRNMDKSIKEGYKTRLNNMNLLGYYIDPQDDTDECELDTEKMTDLFVDSNNAIRRFSGNYTTTYKLMANKYIFMEGVEEMEFRGQVNDGTITWTEDIPDELLKILGIEEEDETSNEENGDMYKSGKIYCPNNCGSFRKTLNGMYSHLGLSLNSANNCKKKQKIQKKKEYKKALEKVFNGELEIEDIDISAYCKQNNEPPPKYESTEDPKKSRKTIPKAVKITVWNTYAKELDVKKLTAKCFVGCGREITIVDFELGHVEAYSNGGSNKIDNLRPICSLCNKSMGATNMFDFMKNYGMGLHTSNDIEPEKIELKIAELVLNITGCEKESLELSSKKTTINSKLVELNSSNLELNVSIKDTRENIESIKNNTKQIIKDLQETSDQKIKLLSDKIESENNQIYDSDIQINRYNQEILSINSNLDLIWMDLIDISNEKQKYEFIYQEYISKKEASHLIMIQELEKEVIKELEIEKIKNEIRSRLLNTYTKEGNIINLM